MAVDLHLDIFLTFLYFFHVCYFFHCFDCKIHEISEIGEDLPVFKFVKFRSATFDVFRKNQHKAFLKGNAVALTEEVVSHQTFDSVGQRHVLGEASDEVGKFKLIISREMSSQSQQS